MSNKSKANLLYVVGWCFVLLGVLACVTALISGHHHNLTLYIGGIVVTLLGCLIMITGAVGKDEANKEQEAGAVGAARAQLTELKYQLQDGDIVDPNANKLRVDCGGYFTWAFGLRCIGGRRKVFLEPTTGERLSVPPEMLERFREGITQFMEGFIAELRAAGSHKSEPTESGNSSPAPE